MTPTVHLELAKRERIEKAKRERAKMEVVLNLGNSSNRIKEQVESLHDKALTEVLQEHILDEAKLTNNPPIRIRGVKKLTKHTVKIQCHEEQDASTLEKIKCETLEGATIIKSTFGVVIHGISKNEVKPNTQTQDEIKAILEEDNDIKVDRVTPLMRRI